MKTFKIKFIIHTSTEKSTCFFLYKKPSQGSDSLENIVYLKSEIPKVVILKRGRKIITKNESIKNKHFAIKLTNFFWFKDLPLQNI